MPKTALPSILKQFNRPYEVDEETADFLFAMYLLLRKAPKSMSNHAKKRTFENAADSAHAWRVVCISEKALKHIAENKSAAGLRRAHAMPREERFQQIFGEDAREWGRGELLSFFFEHDTCALVTGKENNQHTTEQWSKLYPVEEGILCKGSFAVYARKTIDVPWAEKLWEKVQSKSP
ncbi:hypothetical protein [Aquabacterium sp.]|uniref:hypothetical protein n=1 Tax=Aquabacterium sp. TaxID=1872578 RepID=UPI0024891371|nr:hypothetical protein [Aquabacterium sp.]MDI1258273.1 hypothetical protein [Aquabacterium sp.]